MHEVYKRGTQAERRAGWVELERAWRKSGLTAKLYCEQTGIRLSDLRRWSYRFSKDKTNHTKECASVLEKSTLGFIPLQLQNSPSTTAKSNPIDLLIGTHYRLQIDQDFDEGLLLRLLSALERVIVC